MKLARYNRWEEVKEEDNPSFLNFFGSGGGTFFDVSKLNKNILDKDVFQQICALGDDIWLNAFCRLAGMKTYVIDNKSVNILNVQIAKDQRLYQSNCVDNMNDIQIENVRAYFKQEFDMDPFEMED